MVTSNISGGYNKDRTARYSDQYIIGADFDLQKIAGITDGEFKVSVIDRNGRDLTSDRIQDPRAPVIGSTVNSNYGRGQTWHAAQFWYRQSWYAKTIDLKLGLMPVGEDFDNNGCYFQNLSLCGSLAGHGAGVWYNTPIGQWGPGYVIILHRKFICRPARLCITQIMRREAAVSSWIILED